MTIRFMAMPTEEARRLQRGGLDANGQAPERHISDGDGVPCRHCLEDVAKGEPFLILSYRPFDSAQPYAEAGPIFLCASECERHAESSATPTMFLERERFFMRGYDRHDRIVYGSGKIVASEKIEEAAAEVFANPDITYLHLRSGSYNCYQCRIERTTSAPL